MLDKPANNKSPQQHVEEWVFEQTDGVVQSGPFTGMRLSREKAWPDTAMAAMLLGTWEQELHDAIESEIIRLQALDNPQIANIGCAEGYYAVGLAQRLPKATVYAVDIDEAALEVTTAAATANGVEVVTGAPMAEVFGAPDLVVMDCEGSEVTYLNVDEFPALAGATIIVEIHNLIGFEPAHPVIMERLKATHTIENIYESGRDPNRFAFLRQCHSALRWMAVCENRPCLMNWFVCRPRGRK